MSKVSLVIVSHSDKLAQGVAEVAAQMAPDIAIRAAGGLQDGNIGTSFDKVDAAVQELVADGPVVLLTDLGSATLTVDSVLDFLDDEPVYFADGPLVEGAVAGAVAAQQGADAEGVIEAVRDAAKTWGAFAESETEPSGEDVCEAEVAIADPDGLHARPAALVARFVSDYDAQVTIDGADAASVMSLMALGVRQGKTVTVRASGADAQRAVSDLVQKLKSMPE
ncbi:dihydroxyacetone kinase phosphoryl donor subunit DhaM [Actinomyces urinae]|uniref:dihydroxyacetone kinase phosphoryl donor subunit DhaM n=1 Tax=Actinomyces urinae TaxID=1689268 RepID=UPI0009304570|nr:dihydroxyacetone kinase phosphoryl donor subunit DhaM [Actinomyces urinae]